MIEIADFLAADCEEVIALWRGTEGLTLREVDSPQSISRYLARNPGLSFVVRDGGRLVGAVLTGTDGRRGYLQHLAVAQSYRGQGVGRALAERAVEALEGIGITKCHLMVRRENSQARAFWEHLGWDVRSDVVLMSRTGSHGANA